MTASAIAPFGINEFAARFWSAMAGCGVVMVTFLFARTVTNLRCAVLSSLILATSLEMLVLAHLAITDMILTFFVASSLYCFFMAVHKPVSQRQASWALCGWAAAAAAVLIKGPIGIFFALLIFGLFL